MRGGIAKVLHVLSAVKRRAGKPRRAGPAAACTDVPEDAAGGVHQGGAGVSDRYHVSTETIGACRRREATNHCYFKPEQYGQLF